MPSGLKELNIAVTGGTGFVGSALIDALLQRGHRVKCITRDPASAALPGGATPVGWDDLESGLSDVDAVVHLAGAPAVGQRLTSARKRLIMESRVGTTKSLVQAMKRLPHPPQVFVSASAIGYYGDCGFEEIKTEEDAPGDDFLARVCVNWEAAAIEAEGSIARVVRARIGIVLGKGGPLGIMALPFKMFVGGPIAGGKQPVSWIDRRDAARALIHCVENDNVVGPVNLVSPNATTNGELSATIARTLKRPNLFPVPKFGLKMIFAEGADAIASGQHVKPARLLESEFKFEHTDLAQVVRDHLL